MKLVNKILSTFILTSVPFSSFATPVPIDDFIAISAYLGGRYSPSLKDTETDQTADISNSFSQALAVSWYYGRNTEGELLYSNAKHNVSMSSNQKTGKNISTDLHISYLHFGGRVNFVDASPFSTSLGLGIGATFFTPNESEYSNDIALSGNITGGIRYELSKQWALKADLRFYGTVLKNNSSLLCSNSQCYVTLSGEVYMQTELMAGIEYKF